MNGGRPLRFLAVVLFGWVMGRGIAIYDSAHDVTPQEPALAPRHMSGSPPSREPATDAMPAPLSDRPADIVAAAARPAFVHRPVPAPPTMSLAARASTVQVSFDPPLKVEPAPLLAPATLRAPIASRGPRWAVSAWLIARGGMAASVAGSQLGASQAGMRVTYALGHDRRVALAARVSAPLSGRGREAAVGFDWQPTAAPIHVIAEQRVSLDGGRGGAMVGVVGGFGPAEVAPGLRIEAYGQAGVIARDRGEGFADGAVRAAHPLPPIGGLHPDIGAGIWGGAQRGASRLDVGPSFGIVAPLAGHTVRLSADWRQRIAGTARPGSGPALSIGTNF